MKNPTNSLNVTTFQSPESAKTLTYRQAHRATAAYYGMIEWMDAQFNRVIEKLEHLNVLDDFIIVFLSDHGEMLGTKGVWEKQSFFDGSARRATFYLVPEAIWTGIENR